jgi:ubiquinone/menaquinone biosynthesis C-methylase UbiE
VTDQRDEYAGLKGRFYRAYIRRPRLARVVGTALWGSDFRPLYRHLGRLATLPEGAAVIDAACGAGLALEWLDPTRRHRYVGIDRSPAMLEAASLVAARRSFPDATFHSGDVTALPMADREAQVGLSYNALHCLPDPQAALVELVRCVAPRGVVLGSTLVRGSSARADRILAADATMGPGGTINDLEDWLRGTAMVDIELETSGAMALFRARRPG